MIELIRSYKNVTYDKAEELFYVGDKKRRNSQIHKYSREEWVQSLFAWRDDVAFGSAAVSFKKGRY